MKSITSRLVDLAIRIQQIPAPTFDEFERAEFVRKLFEKEDLSDVEIDSTGNVYARLPGADSERPPIVVSAHLDTVFPRETPLEIIRKDSQIFGAGIGDNSFAVASLAGLIWLLRDRAITLPGDLWLVANVCEEGLGDLNGMKAVVDRFYEQPVAYLVLEGTALGHVYHRALRVRRYRITFSTIGGHSWAHFGRPSAIHEIAGFITNLADIHFPEVPRTTYNVGVIEGGTSINTIAPKASVELDLRSESSGVLEDIIRQVESLVESRKSEHLDVDMEIIGDRPGGELPVDHPLVELAVRSLHDLQIEPQLRIGSTDANIPLSHGLQAVCIGVTLGGGAHTMNEFILTKPITTGLTHVLDMVTGIWDLPPHVIRKVFEKEV